VANLPEASGMKVKCSCCGAMFTLPAISTAPLPLATGYRPSAVAGHQPSTISQRPPASIYRPPAIDQQPLAESGQPAGDSRRWVVAVVGVGALALLLATAAGLTAYYVWPGKHKSDEQARQEQKNEDDRSQAPNPLPLTPLDDKQQGADKGERRRDPSDSGRGRRQPLADDSQRRPQPLTSLPEAEQRKVNAAIDGGVAYLRKNTKVGGGAFHGGHEVGYAALPGLTLLECGVPADDALVREAAAYVRKNSVNLQLTYDLALAILFLDRLGDRSDRDLIRTLAVRLVAGQRGDGGWTYMCPVLSAQDSKKLLAIMEETRPASPADLFQPIDSDKPDKPSAPKREPKRPKKDKVGPRGKPPANFLNLPALQDKPVLQGNQGSDNSNSQFALLALWTAQRCGVPVERSLALVVQRYRSTQNPDGGWGYHPGQPTTPAMTCVGLLGLAVGHGFRDAAKSDPVRDPRIEKAMKQVSRHVGKPTGRDQNVPMGNLYYLWSLERVAVLYNLGKIGDKDWYAWGAELLVANQRPGGGWLGLQYPGNNFTLIDTCFALLFLKRANFVKDLTQKIEFLRIDAAPQK
jgi:hypothetical protein